MRRVLSADFLNVVANDPHVRPWLGRGTEPLDITALVSNPANVAVQNGHGGFVAQQTEPGVYELHSLMLPEGRGKQAVELLQELLSFLFLRTNATEVVTKVPAGNDAALGLARLVGARQLFTVKGTFDGKDVAAYGLGCQDWALKSVECYRAGQTFHDVLEDAKLHSASERPVHADDATHDYMAGFTVLAVQAGNIWKAASVYNRWARLAGYGEITVLSDQPALLDIGDAICGLSAEGSVEVLVCR